MKTHSAPVALAAICLAALGGCSSSVTGEARALREKLSASLHAATAEVSNAKLRALLKRADTAAAKLVDTYDSAAGLEDPNLKRLLMAMQDLDQLCG